MEQEKLLEDLGETYGYLKAYVEKRVELARLGMIEKFAKAMSFLISLVAFLLIIGMVVLLLSLALGFYLSEVLGSNSLAFLILSGVYLVIGLLVFALRNPLIRNPLIGQAIRSLDE